MTPLATGRGESIRMVAARAELADGGVPAERRLELLKVVPAFAHLPTPALEELAERLEEERYPSGATMVTEGKAGDRLYLIAEGRAEVSTAGQGVSVPLATLGPGELFGEIALLEPGGRRQATVTAIEPLLVLSLEGPDFHRVLDAHQEARTAFSEAVQTLLAAKFLKQASPFSTLDGARLRKLAAHLQPKTVPADATIVRQGEYGKECYLLQSGRVQVVVEEEEGEGRNLATLEAGSLFGEAALLTDAPRNATVRALEPCDLLALRRTDLLEAIGEDRHTGDRMLELLRLRDRPRQKPGVEAHHRTTPTGETITTLKYPQRGAYYRLSPRGFFLWQRLDGSHTLRDLSLEYLVEFGAFAPQAISDTIGGLAEAGFVEGARPAGAVLERVARTTGWQRATEAARRIMEWQGSVRSGRAPNAPLQGRDVPPLHPSGSGPPRGHSPGRDRGLRPGCRGARHDSRGVAGRRLAVVVLDPGDPGRALSS